ncbi:hypothetical protein MRX96_020119 [Rhipicephalus microplus]
MAGASSPSPQRHLDAADEFQSSSPTTDVQRRGGPPLRGALGRLLRIQAPWPEHASSGPTRSRFHTPTNSNSESRRFAGPTRPEENPKHG